MDRSRFWGLVGEARTNSGNEDEFLSNITARLKTLTPEHLVSFEKHFVTLHRASYSWELWGAAYLINGGCSDDGFDYFRAWLIAQGQQVFDWALENPDTLAEIENPEGELEDFLYLPANVYEEKTGKEFPEEVYECFSFPELGEGWDFDDDAEMEARYPALSAKY